MTNSENDVMQLLEKAVRTATAGSADSAYASEQVAALLKTTQSANGSTQQAATSAASEALASIGSGTSVAGVLSGRSTTSEAISYVNPILGALWSLFGGGDSTSSTTLEKATLPDSINYKLGIAGATGTVETVDRDAQGQARSTSSTGSNTASVVVNIQAIDTQSFLDRTPEIAQAVKRALLESDGLGTVIGEL